MLIRGVKVAARSFMAKYSQNLTIITSAGGGSWGANSRIILDCVATDGGSALTVS